MTGKKRASGSDLKKVDAHSIQPHEYDEIPELTDEFFRNAKVGPYRPRKAQITLRLDMDVLDWFKRHAEDGKGYQTDINRALREYIAAKEKAG
jgi:uncharacterized protein (DUF4415 family)